MIFNSDGIDEVGELCGLAVAVAGEGSTKNNTVYELQVRDGFSARTCMCV